MRWAWARYSRWARRSSMLCGRISCRNVPSAKEEPEGLAHPWVSRCGETTVKRIRAGPVPSGLLGPVLPRSMCAAHRNCESHAQAAGARPGVNLRALSRHIRWQGADLVDLSNSEQEL